MEQSSNVIEINEEKKNTPVEVTEAGFFRAKDIEGQYRIAKALFVSKMVPKGYDSAEKVLAGMQYAIELGLKPFQGLRNISIINGNPAIWGDLPLALAKKTGELEAIYEFIIDKEYKPICFDNKNLDSPPYAAICRIKRTGMEVIESHFTTTDAEKAGLLGRSGGSPWQTYPKIMLMRRARSNALKMAFPDALAGIAIAEYDFNYIPQSGESRDVTFNGQEVKNSADELNNIFGE